MSGLRTKCSALTHSTPPSVNKITTAGSGLLFVLKGEVYFDGGAGD